jgi:hypothetical protein
LGTTTVVPVDDVVVDSTQTTTIPTDQETILIEPKDVPPNGVPVHSTVGGTHTLRLTGILKLNPVTGVELENGVLNDGVVPMEVNSVVVGSPTVVSNVEIREPSEVTKTGS